jgi:hypothetical protein
MFTLGCDPECFLLNKDGHVVSAIGKIGGTKYEPKPILTEVGRGFAIQEDNVLLEYNVPPASSLSEFTDNLDLIHHWLDKHLLQMGLSRAKLASHSMDPKEMDHPMAWKFGCEPDFNAWTLKVNPRPKCDDPLLRSAGGHIHIGKQMIKSQAIATVRWLDRLLGGFLIQRDPDTRRQQLYGQPGSMRFKSYGIEYRVPSNWWTFQDSSTLENIWEIIDEAISRGDNGKLETPKKDSFGPECLANPEAYDKWRKA